MATRKKKPAAKPSRFPSAMQAKFLGAYAEVGNVTAAARLSGVARADHYRWLRTPAYVPLFEAAHEEAIELLEAEVRRRACRGVAEPVVYQGQFTYEQARNPAGELLFDPETGKPVLTDKPLTVLKYSDNLLMFLLKGERPNKYRDNAKVEITGSLDVVVERLQAARKRLKQ